MSSIVLVSRSLAVVARPLARCGQVVVAPSCAAAASVLTSEPRVLVVDAALPGAEELLQHARDVAPTTWRLVTGGQSRWAHQVLVGSPERQVRVLCAFAAAPPAAELAFRDVRDDAERQAAHQLACRIYCEEHLGQRWEDAHHRFAMEASYRRARVFVATVGDQIVATVAVHAPGSAPLAAQYRLDGAHAVGVQPAQGSHTACLAEWRGLGLAERLWQHALVEAARAGYRDLVCMAATSVRCRREMREVVAELTRQGLGESRFRLDLKAKAVEAPERPARLVRVPKLLSQYARVGFRVCGPPVYEPRFRMYDLPMCISLEALGQRAAA